MPKIDTSMTNTVPMTDFFSTYVIVMHDRWHIGWMLLSNMEVTVGALIMRHSENIYFVYATQH